MCRLALVPAVAAVFALLAPLPADAQSAAPYRPPVDGPIVDPYRPPAHTGGTGNRGVDYATTPGALARAAADGEVTFAGSVGASLHVVVLHADGVRTSYSFLQTVRVRRGDRVRQGDVVGTTGDRLHFGARVGDGYIDPTTLFGSGPPRVYLVPDEVRRPGSEAEERSGLARLPRSTGGVVREIAGVLVDRGKTKVSDLVEEVRGVTQYTRVGHPALIAWGLVRNTAEWWRQRSDCTPASTSPPPLPERRVAVLVGGLASGGEPLGSAVTDVDAPALGYVDTVRFSYNGGTTQDTTYGPRDTTQDLRRMADQLLAVLQEVRRQHPAEAVDIIGHSQGGLIARRALAYGYDAGDPSYPRVANLITLATPHTGADLATAATMVAKTSTGEYVGKATDGVQLLPFDLTGDSIDQMSETSWFLTELNRAKPPDGVRFTSIGARGDWIVPALHTRSPGSRDVIVPVPGGWGDHRNLPGSDAGRREVALAAAGLAPTCQTLTDMLGDYAISTAISTVEDAAGAALYAGGRYVDRKAARYGPKRAPVTLPGRRTP